MYQYIIVDDAVGQVNICWKYFSEIIKHTTTHQQVLERIKGEYEEALFSKEEQLSNDPLLPSPLSHAVTATRDELEKSHLRVSKKEAELYKLYHGNKELQQQLSNQIRSLSDLEKQVRSYINININCRLRLIEPTVNWVKAH